MQISDVFERIIREKVMKGPVSAQKGKGGVKMSVRDKVVVCFTVLSLAVFSLGCVSASQALPGDAESLSPNTDNKVYELHSAYSVAENPDSQHTIRHNAFKKEVEDKTDGKIRIIIHPGGELGGEREYVEMMMTGELAFATMSTAVFSGFTDALKFYDVPMLFKDGDQVIKFTESDLAMARLEELKKIGVIGMSTDYVAPRHFLTVKNKPVRNLSDLKNLKMRVMETPVQIEAMQMLGAQPTPLPYTECYQALQTGVIDGMENEVDTYIAMRFYEVAPNYSQVGWLQLVHAFGASKRVMDSLPVAYQQIILTAAKNAGRLSTQMGIEYRNTKAAQKLKEVGANVIEVDTAEFRKRLEPLVEKYRDLIGQDILKWIAANS